MVVLLVVSIDSGATPRIDVIWAIFISRTCIAIICPFIRRAGWLVINHLCFQEHRGIRLKPSKLPPQSEEINDSIHKIKPTIILDQQQNKQTRNSIR
jgi:hypothetical protein